MTVQRAYWHYIDFVLKETPSLPKLSELDFGMARAPRGDFLMNFLICVNKQNNRQSFPLSSRPN